MKLNLGLFTCFTLICLCSLGCRPTAIAPNLSQSAAVRTVRNTNHTVSANSTAFPIQANTTGIPSRMPMPVWKPSDAFEELIGKESVTLFMENDQQFIGKVIRTESQFIVFEPFRIEDPNDTRDRHILVNKDFIISVEWDKEYSK